MQGLIIINKSRGWTSHDAVAKLRGILHERRVGHAGTLDPMAEGVLPVMIGRATRASDFCSGWDKEYIATVRLGVTTDTYDITGTVINESPVNISKNDFISACDRFVGEINQLPPMYSAIQIDGKRLYDLARAGKTVERETRRIHIYSITQEGNDGNDYRIRVACSKGTYIRSLAYDIGQTLGCGATLSGLIRTKTGPFLLENAHTIDEIKSDPTGCILPTDSLFAEFPRIELSGKAEKLIRCGGDISSADFDIDDGRCRLYGENGEFLAIAVKDGETIHTEKSFFEVSHD